MNERPLRVGISSRLMHSPPAELGFRGKTLLYLEQTIAHWVMAHGALAVMVPTLSFDSAVTRRQVSVREYADSIDALLLQGGADVNPAMYGQAPLRPEWSGDIVRDRYEIELIEAFLSQGKPVLGICRGAQLINVAYGGTLMQDIATQRPQARIHVDAGLYDELEHELRFKAGSRLAALYSPAETARVNSIHHQAIDRLGGDLEAEAHSAEDGVVEAIRVRGPLFVVGVQWHPEFHWRRNDRLDPEPLLNSFLDAARKAIPR